MARSGTNHKGGRPSIITSKRSIAAAAREYGEEALKVFADVMRDDAAPPSARIDAAAKLLDRGYGKPLQTTADLTNRLDEMDDAVLDAAIAAARERLGLADELGAGEATAH